MDAVGQIMKAHQASYRRRGYSDYNLFPVWRRETAERCFFAARKILSQLDLTVRFSLIRLRPSLIFGLGLQHCLPSSPRRDAIPVDATLTAATLVGC